VGFDLVPEAKDCNVLYHVNMLSTTNFHILSITHVQKTGFAKMGMLITKVVVKKLIINI
jgi:hypothetical protein